jgi:glutathione S-transferase
MIPQDCSGKVRWLLHELDVPFEDIKLSYKNGDLKTTDYLSKNPIGQVPVFEDEDVTLFESYAIVSYLTDKYSTKGLGSDSKNIKERAQYNQWLYFTNNTVEDFFNRYFKLPKMTEEYNNDWGDYIREKIQKIMMTIEKQVTSQDFILKNFSAVDICLSNALDMVSEESFFHDFPKTKVYYDRLSKREACLKSEIFKRN